MLRNRTLPPLILVLVTLVVRLIYASMERTVWGDEPFYLWLGRNLLRGDGFRFAFTGHFDYHHSPGYPLITGLLTLLTRDLQRASEWAYILFSVVLVVAVYILAQRIYGWRSAFGAGLLVALIPATAYMPLYWGTMTEPAYLGLVMVGLVFAHRTYHDFSAMNSSLAGMFLAFAYYVRPEAIVYVGVVGFILGIRALASAPRLRRLAYPALLGLVFAIAVFPYLLRLRMETGTWSVSQKVGAHFATASGLAAGGSFQQFDQETWGLDSTGNEVRFFSTETADATASEFILADPLTYLLSVYGNTLEMLNLLFSPRLIPGFALPFLGIALLRRAWTRRRAWDELFLITTLLPGLSFVLFFVQERYIAATVPTLLIWFGHGLIESGDWLRATINNLGEKSDPSARRFGALVWVPLTLMTLFLLLYGPRYIDTATNPGSTRPAHRMAGEVLASELNPTDIVMSRYSAIPFHAGTEWVPTPAADVNAALAYAQSKGASFWAIDAIEAEVLRPQFRPLIQDSAPPPEGLEVFTSVDDGDGAVVIYRILP